MKLNDRLSQQMSIPEVDKSWIPYIDSYSGRKIMVSTLRPGDRLMTTYGSLYTVVQNSAAKRKLECCDKTRPSIVFDYHILGLHVWKLVFLGHRLTRWERFKQWLLG